MTGIAGADTMKETVVNITETIMAIMTITEIVANREGMNPSTS
jgi:hypothetical protein